MPFTAGTTGKINNYQLIINFFPSVVLVTSGIASEWKHTCWTLRAELGTSAADETPLSLWCCVLPFSFSCFFLRSERVPCESVHAATCLTPCPAWKERCPVLRPASIQPWGRSWHGVFFLLFLSLEDVATLCRGVLKIKLSEHLGISL